MVYTALAPPAAFTPISSSSWGSIVAANFADHETRIAACRADIDARGRVTAGDSTTGPTNVTTTETAFHSLTGTLISGRPYRYNWVGTVVANGATGTPYHAMRIRYIAGGTFTVAGSTEVYNWPITLVAPGNWQPHNFVGEFYAPFTGTFSVAMTVVRTGGNGGIDIRGGAQYRLDCVR